MKIIEKLKRREAVLSVVGLGYVGLPLAIAFSKKVRVLGFDVNPEKIRRYQAGEDPTHEVGSEAVKGSSVEFTHDEMRLQSASFHIIAVPTPIKQDKTPDLEPVVSASMLLGRNLKAGSVVVYESTVYPGVTEEVCIPILEEASGLKAGVDFHVGYSPERINPGDPVHRLETIVKIVSAVDEEAREEIAKVYEMIITAGVHRTSSIKVAEAAKVVENSQRDINIAFMNELAMVFDRMGIDTMEVIEAMNTKWNALGFHPGLVGGHCIGVDPYYFIYQAEKLGYHSQIIASGRKINDGMAEFVADAVIRKLIEADKVVRQSKIVILGLTFKENTPDTRNSKVVDIIRALQSYGIQPQVVDPVADGEEAREVHGIEVLRDFEKVRDVDAIILAVAHEGFRALTLKDLDAFFLETSNDKKIIVDVRSILDKDELEREGYRFWRL